MKTRIEEAADEYVKQYDNEPDKSWSRLDFIAGAEFMQGEINELTKEYDETCSTLKNSSLYISSLEEKLKTQTHNLNVFNVEFIQLEEKLKMAEKERDDYCEDFLKYMKSNSVEVQAHSVTREKLKVAVEALEFYANKENWQAPEDQGFEHHDTLNNELADMIHEDHDNETGGKRAREALKKVKDAE